MGDLVFHGQAEQDKFVCNILKNKRDGFFVEVGAHHPINISNTYTLESNLGWTGLMFEWAQAQFEDLYKQHRPNSNYIFGDAQYHDYDEILDKYNAPKDIDYLQLDIEPPNKTLNVLKNLENKVLNDYKFAVVTFEHDYCHGMDSEPRLMSRQIFESRGYHRVFDDIHNQDPRYVYEDWYVHPDLVDMDYVVNLQKINKQNYESSIFESIGESINWQNIIYP